MIELIDLSFYYHSRAGDPLSVFENFNLLIPQGRYVALMGPNGSGKSTLGKLIKGLLTPRKGIIRIAGQTLKPGEISPRVGYIFSNPENQIISPVVEEDIAFGLENMGLDQRDIASKVEQGLALVGMEDYRCVATHNLSGGQQQKIVLAGVLAMDCEVLILDEPTSMLDLKDQEDILRLLTKLHTQEGKTILHITHSFSAALRAQDFIFLEQGQILFYGPWEDFFSKLFVHNRLPIVYPPLWELLRRWGELGLEIPVNIRFLEELQEFLTQALLKWKEN